MSTSRFPLSRLVLALVLAVTAAAAPALAANTPKVKYIRIRESSTGEYRMEVTTNGATTAASWVTVETDQERSFILKSEAFRRRMTATAATGEVGVKGMTVRFALVDTSFAILFEGIAYVAPGATSGAVVGKGAGFSVGDVQLLKTEKAGVYAVSFTAEGEGAAAIAGGKISTEAVSADGRLVTASAALDPAAFSDERTFSAPARFDGDPVGHAYELVAKLIDETGQRAERVQAEVEMTQLPSGPCGGPGPILSVTSNGKGTRPVATTTNGKPNLL